MAQLPDSPSHRAQPRATRPQVLPAAVFSVAVTQPEKRERACSTAKLTPLCFNLSHTREVLRKPKGLCLGDSAGMSTIPHLGNSPQLLLNDSLKDERETGVGGGKGEPWINLCY